MNDSVNDNENRKNEILTKSRKCQKDEGWEFAEKRGNKIGVILYAIVAVVFMIFSIPDHIVIVEVIAALSLTWTVGGTFSYYRFTKRKAYLICSILLVIACIGFAVMSILTLLA